MKNRIWLFQLPLIALFAFAFWVHEAGVNAELAKPFLRDTIWPALARISNTFLDLKFRARGALINPSEAASAKEAAGERIFKNPNKIVIVEIDSDSINRVGRWPWPRKHIAQLVRQISKHSPKAIGFDIVFADPTFPVHPAFACTLQRLLRPDQSKIVDDLNAREFGDDSDLLSAFGTSVRPYGDRENGKSIVALGWATEGTLIPKAYPEIATDLEHPDRKTYLQQLYQEGNELDDPIEVQELRNAGCRINNPPPSRLEQLSMNIAMKSPDGAFYSVDEQKTPIATAMLPVANIGLLHAYVGGAGLFDALVDSDGTIRRTTMVKVFDKKLYPNLALEMARIGLEAGTKINFDRSFGIESITVEGQKKTKIATNPSGIAQINFRGGSKTFPYLSAKDIFEMDDPSSTNAPMIKELLRDAYVLIGVTAVGVFDMRAFPYSSNMPGTEGWANILDNILSNDFLTHGPLSSGQTFWLLLSLIILGGVMFALAIEKLESLQGLAFGLVVMLFFWLVDFKLLFSKQNIFLNTSFVYVELTALFVITNAVKYVLEERNKKFIKGAFSKYVAPAIVDSILKDPTKLTVGGERRELSILFSDIRGFTTFSERMDPKQLAAFLNDYLGIMTDVVFDNEGTLDKYIGDAVMAFWGAPLDQAKHAANACKAAKIMLQKLAEHRPRFQSQYGVEVNIGIGINSGLVNVGNMGSDRIFEYTVIGDHVNLASRLEGLTKYYGAGIVTSRFTFDLILKGGEPLPAHRTLDSVKVKGKKDAIELIQVLERDYDAEGLKLFEEARQLYLQQKWDEAIIRFKEASTRLEPGEAGDGPSLMYIERCEELKTTGVESDWDGAWKMTSK